MLIARISSCLSVADLNRGLSSIIQSERVHKQLTNVRLAYIIIICTWLNIHMCADLNLCEHTNLCALFCLYLTKVARMLYNISNWTLPAVYCIFFFESVSFVRYIRPKSAGMVWN